MGKTKERKIFFTNITRFPCFICTGYGTKLPIICLLAFSGLWHYILTDHALFAQSNSEPISSDNNAFEATYELFEVRDLTIDITARNAVLARTEAFEQAQLKAFEILLHKLTEVSRKGRTLNPSLAEITPLITGIDVISENFSTRRYIASFNIRFSPQSLSNYFGIQDIPHVLSAGPDIVIIDLYQEKGTLSLWGDDALSQAGNSLITTNRIRRYSFLKPDFSNRLRVSATSLINAEETLMTDLGQLVTGSDFLFLDVRKIASGEYYYKYLLSEVGQFVEGTFLALPDEDQQESLKRLYIRILDEIDSLWRQQLLVDTGEGGVLDIEIVTNRAKDYAEIISRLEATSLVSSYGILEIAIPASRFAVAYKGRIDQLILALSYNGLYLQQRNDSFKIELVPETINDEAINDIDTTEIN